MTDAARREEKALALTPYLILGFLVLVLALIVRAPASLLQKAVPAASPLRVNAWGGTLWNGQAAFTQGGEGGFLGWRWQPLSLLKGNLALEARAQGALEVTGLLELGLRGWRVQRLQGEIPASLVQSLLPAGWRLPGRVEATDLLLAHQGYGRQGAWRAAGGRLRWSGGVMQFAMSGQLQSATLPPLLLSLRLEGDTAVLSLDEEAGNQGLATIRLGPDGVVETQLRERLLRYSPSYRGSGSNPDAVVVTAKQAL